MANNNEKKSPVTDSNKVYGNPGYGAKDDIYSQQDKVPFTDPGDVERMVEDDEDDNAGNTLEDIKGNES